MSKAKNPNTRIKLIYDFICEGSEPGKKRIVKYLNSKGISISDKTVVNDLGILKSKNLIMSTGLGRSVEYLPIDKFRNIEFEKDLLDTDDLFSLEMAFLSLNQLKFFTLSKDLQTIINKIEKEVNKSARFDKEIVSFQNSFLRIKPETFQTIFEATSHEKVLDIQYISFNSSLPIAIVFHPYFIKQFNNRWFVIGYREDESKVDHLGIERINKVKINFNLSYNDAQYIKPEIYSSNLFGITNSGSQSQKIELLFTENRAPYFISKPVVDNIEVVVKKDKTVKISFECKINKELVAEILSYGNDVTVLKPKALREKVSTIIKSALEKYGTT